MRRVSYVMSVSLDGYLEGPDREIDWHRVDEELHQHFNDELATAGAFLDGRITYELMAGFWPFADEDAAASDVTKEFARIWRDMPKTVYSRTLRHADWNTTIVREIDPDVVRELSSGAASRCSSRTTGEPSYGSPRADSSATAWSCCATSAPDLIFDV
jgi:dihydrofolate reductase